MAKKKPFYIEGIPIPAKWKLFSVLVLFLILLMNVILPVYIDNLDYAFNGGVSLFLLLLIVLISTGNKLTEGIVIGISIFAIMSNIWDLFVMDISDFRKQVLVGSVFVLLISLGLGKISITNLISILKGQLGVKK